MRLLAQDVNLWDPNSPYRNVQNLLPQDYVAAVVNLLLGAAGVLSFIFMLVGGIQWITAGNDKDALDRARRRIINAVLGLVLIFSVYAMLIIIETLFGVDLRYFDVPQI